MAQQAQFDYDFVVIGSGFGGSVSALRLAEKMNGYPKSAWSAILLNAPTTAHILGGCAMAASPAQGVVGFDGEIFGYPHLYVADGSVIPANLGVNPSLTITAVAEYIMSQMPAKPR
jgi:cholesterol oxidase